MNTEENLIWEAYANKDTSETIAGPEQSCKDGEYYCEKDRKCKPLEEGNNKKPDKDDDGVPDWADKKPGEDDHDDTDDKKQVDENLEEYEENTYNFAELQFQPDTLLASAEDKIKGANFLTGKVADHKGVNRVVGQILSAVSDAVMANVMTPMENGENVVDSARNCEDYSLAEGIQSAIRANFDAKDIDDVFRQACASYRDSQKSQSGEDVRELSIHATDDTPNPAL